MRLDHFEAVNVLISVEVRPGVDPHQLAQNVLERVEQVGATLGGDDGPLYHVSREANSVVEVWDERPFWRVTDIEPHRRG